MRTKTVLATVLTVALIAPLSASAATKTPPPNQKVVATQLALRNLWTNHIFWVRNVVVAVHDNNSAAAKTAEKQVVANAKTIAGAITPFYGEKASKALFKLLAGHWMAIKQYLMATDNDSQSGQQKAAKALYTNAGKIADFLAAANPKYWPKKATLPMLNSHAGLHIAQINEIYAGNYKQEAETWKAFIKNVDGMADALTTGLAKKFPNKFK